VLLTPRAFLLSGDESNHQAGFLCVPNYRARERVYPPSRCPDNVSMSCPAQPTAIYCVTVNTPELVAVPPGVVIWILPVSAPVGTVAVT